MSDTPADTDKKEPSKVASAIALAITLVALYFIWSYFISPATRAIAILAESASATSKEVTVSVTGAQQINRTCHLFVNFENEGDALIDRAGFQASAVNASGQVIGVAIALTSNLRAHGNAAEDMLFTRTECAEIQSLTGANGAVGSSIKISTKTVLPIKS